MLALHHRIETTAEARLLGFSYDLGITVIRHKNADAMVLTSALMRSIHPPDNIQNGGRPGGMPLISTLVRTMASAF
jgi:hypothetical protein